MKTRITTHVRDENRRGVHYFAKTLFWVFWDTVRDRDRFSGNVELVLSRPRLEFSALFHVDARWSGNPFAGHFTILGSGIFWGISVGGKLAQRITRGEGRTLQIAVHHGRLWIKAWTRPDEHGGRREKAFRVNPLDIILGPLRYAYEDVDEVTRLLAIEGQGPHEVRLRLQRVTYGRAKGRKTMSWGVDWTARPGIPVKPDRGGWKTGVVCGSGFTVSDQILGWQDEAITRLATWVRLERAKNHYDPATEGATDDR